MSLVPGRRGRRWLVVAVLAVPLTAPCSSGTASAASAQPGRCAFPVVSVWPPPPSGPGPARPPLTRSPWSGRGAGGPSRVLPKEAAGSRRTRNRPGRARAGRPLPGGFRSGWRLPQSSACRSPLCPPLTVPWWVDVFSGPRGAVRQGWAGPAPAPPGWSLRPAVGRGALGASKAAIVNHFPVLTAHGRGGGGTAHTVSVS